MTDTVTSAASVSITGLHKSYGKNEVLRGIDIQVEPGEVVCLIGPSGSGKSTLLRCVNLLEEPNAGTITVGGVEVTDPDADINALRTRMGMVFQQFNLLANRTVAGNVAFPLEIAGWNKSKINERVRECLQIVGLSDRAQHYPAQLSGGQKQRVGIARALAPNPHVILADEPTSALDPATTRSVLDCLQDINCRFNVTIVIVTHEMSVIRRLCRRTALLHQGHLLEVADVRDKQILAHTDIGRELVQED